MDDDVRSCFGFFAAERPCDVCPLRTRCKAVVVTHGMDIVAGVIETMLAELPDQKYRDTDRLPELIEQLINPPNAAKVGLTKEESDLLNALGVSKRVDGEDFDVDLV
jgi:hypothetical protein